MLLLLLLALPLSQGNEQGRPALQEEVDVLVYGTLQLGQALSDTYSSTTNRLQKVAGRQGMHAQTVERLQEEVSRARQERRRLRKEVERLQREEHDRRTGSQKLEGHLQEIWRGHVELQRRVHDLERGVQLRERTIPDLQNRAEQHHLILQVLVQESMRQEKQMAKQREQLLQILKRASDLGSR